MLGNQVQDLTMWTAACLKIDWSRFKTAREHFVVFLGKTLTVPLSTQVYKWVLGSKFNAGGNPVMD